MNTKQQKIIQRFQQVLTFLDANKALIDPATVATQRGILSSSISQVATYAQQQQARGVESAQAHTVKSLRDSLRDSFMRPIAAIALSKLPLTPNLRPAFALPAPKTNALTLITKAQTMASAAQPYASVFMQNGLKASFIDDLNQAITDLHNAVTAATTSRVTQTGATKGIKDQIVAGKAAIKLLDAIVRPELANNKTLLAQWGVIKREAGGPNLGSPAPLPNVVQPITSAPTSTSTATSTAPTTPTAATGTGTGTSSTAPGA